MISYADRFCFGITADYDSAPDIEALSRGIECGVAQLAALGGRDQKPSGATTPS